MTTVTTAERDLYATLWGSVPKYAEHSPGALLVPMFCAMTGAAPLATVLDAGCGTGKGALALAAAGFRVTMVDLTDEGVVAEAKGMPFQAASLWMPDLPPAEYVYCCDVMEHIPPEFTMLTVARLLEASRQGVFFHIALVPDVFGVWVGRPLHQTVQPFSWWRDRLAELGDLVEARDLMESGAYYVRPR